MYFGTILHKLGVYLFHPFLLSNETFAVGTGGLRENIEQCMKSLYENPPFSRATIKSKGATLRLRCLNFRFDQILRQH